MDMKTVYKALPRELFEIVLERYKRCQAHKLDCMQEYMEDNEPGRSGRRWYEFIANNEELEGQRYENAKRQRKLACRMNQLLEDMRYTFEPRPICSEEESETEEEI
jgi:hypothetical protein